MNNVVPPKIRITIIPNQRPVLGARERVKNVRAETLHRPWLSWRAHLTLLAVLLLAFCAGVYFTWASSSSLAQEKEVKQVTPGGKIAISADNLSFGPRTSKSTPVLYTMTVSQIEEYLRDGYKTTEMREEERISARAKSLYSYLESKKSPLATIAEDIARLKHWRIVLAISNSESSLGKRCHSNNCSGIGVEPGHPLWREYKTKADWARDLDRLIEKRYKDWTLEEMNGVYNQPGSSNWVFAAQQVLTDLQSVP